MPTLGSLREGRSTPPFARSLVLISPRPRSGLTASLSIFRVHPKFKLGRSYLAYRGRPHPVPAASSQIPHDHSPQPTKLEFGHGYLVYQVDLPPFQQHICHRLMPIHDSPQDWGLAVVIWPMGVDVFAPQQNLYH